MRKQIQIKFIMILFLPIILGWSSFVGAQTESFDPVSDPVIGLSGGGWGIAAAYNSQDNLFLTATTIDEHIYSATYTSPDLVKLTEPVRVDQGSVGAGSPSVEYSKKSNKFLMVWADGRDAAITGNQKASALMGRFLDNKGTPLENDFVINGSDQVAPGIDLSYDDQTDTYYMFYDVTNWGMTMQTVSSDGKVGPQVRLRNDPAIFPYEGQVSGIYNPVANEIWYAYAATIEFTSAADSFEGVLFQRATPTGQKIGPPITAVTVQGYNAIATPQIAYNSHENQAVIVWMERGRNGGTTGTYYRTIYSDGSLGRENPLLTADNVLGSSGYGGCKSLVYNEFTGTYMCATENDTGTMYVEFLSEGIILEANECIPGAGFGNFYPTLAQSRDGALCMSAVNYEQVHMTYYQSPHKYVAPNQNGPSTSQPRPDLDSSPVTKLVSQLYLYALGLSGLLAVAMCVWGGYIVITARGNAAQATKGKTYIYSSLIGMLLLAAAYLILNTLNTDLTNFRVDDINNLK